MTLQTEGRLSLFQVAGMGCAVTAMAGIALQFGYRFMLGLIASEGGFDILMAGKTDFSRFLLNEFGIIRSVRSMTGHAVTFGKRRMSILRLHYRGQFLVAGKAERSVLRACFQKIAPFPAMGGMARRTLSPCKGLVGTEFSHFNSGLPMTGKTEFPLVLHQQFFTCRFMRRMAVKTAALFGRGMGFRCIRVLLPIVAGKTKGGRFLSEQGLVFRSVSAVAGQTFALFRGQMYTSRCFLRSIMAFGTNRFRSFGQHSGILAAMDSMAFPAAAFLDRTVLSFGLDIIMTGQAQGALGTF